jgi:ligand-binding sensor protein
MHEVVRNRTELLRLASEKELTDIVKSFAKAFNLCGGIVRMTAFGEEPPTDITEMKKWRLTPLINNSPFCLAVRACSRGTLQCMWSDLSYADESAKSRKAICYNCHIGLLDVVAAIKVAGHHVANVYLGQAREIEIQFEDVWRKYQELLSHSKTVNQKLKKEELRAKFLMLPVQTKTKMIEVGRMVQAMAELISQRCTRQLILKNFANIARNTGSTLDVKTSMETFLSCAESVLDCDSSSCWLLSDDGTKLKSQCIHWGISNIPDLELSTSGPGIAPFVLKNHESVLCSSIDEIEARGGQQIDFSRKLRKLESLLAAPIHFGKVPFGVIDIGSTKPKAFTNDDIYILNAIAELAGVSVLLNKERLSFLKVFAHGDPNELADTIVRSVSSQINGEGCSVFLKREDTQDAYLFASDEFSIDNFGKFYYEPSLDDGLTGWVLLKGRSMILPARDGVRTFAIPKEYFGARWKAKYKNEDKRNKNYQDRPYLAAPIKNEAGATIGVIRVSDSKVGSFSIEDLHFLETCGQAIGRLADRFDLFAPTVRPFGSSNRIFISHGRNLRIRKKVIEFFRKCLKLEPVVFDKEAAVGGTITEELERCCSLCRTAVAILTADDFTEHGRPRARQNVIHELGFLHGQYGRRRVLILREQGVELPSNLDGILRIDFKGGHVENKFEDIKMHLTRMGVLKDPSIDYVIADIKLKQNRNVPICRRAH